MLPRDEQDKQERLIISLDHAAVTSDVTLKVWQPDRKFRIDKIWYNNPTGLAQSGTDFYTVAVQNDGNEVAALADTEAAALVADTPVTPEITEANAVVEAGDDITLVFDETDGGGTPTLPAGRLVIEGRYVA